MGVIEFFRVCPYSMRQWKEFQLEYALAQILVLEEHHFFKVIQQLFSFLIQKDST